MATPFVPELRVQDGGVGRYTVCLSRRPFEVDGATYGIWWSRERRIVDQLFNIERTNTSKYYNVTPEIGQLLPQYLVWSLGTS